MRKKPVNPSFFKEKNQIKSNFNAKPQQNDQLFELSSENVEQSDRRQSLLVSPEKQTRGRIPSNIKQLFPNNTNQIDFDRNRTYQQQLFENYINPLRTIQKTIKNQPKTMKNNDFKLTQQDYELDKQKQSDQISNLKNQLFQRDHKIVILQKQLMKLKQNVKKNNSQVHKKSESHMTKQLAFLTRNNQELYQQTVNNRQQIQKYKKLYGKSMEHIKEIQAKMASFKEENLWLKQLNKQLIQEKEMINRNSEEEIKLFRKMQEVWKNIKTNNEYQNPLNNDKGTRSDLNMLSKSRPKSYHSKFK